MRIFLILLLSLNALFAIPNISLTRTLLQFQGKEYNLLLFPAYIVTDGKKRKTKRAIRKGFARGVSELMRQINLRGIDVHLKAFSPKGSNLPQYLTQDKEAYKLLKHMIEMQVKIRSDLEDQMQDVTPTNNEINTKVNVDDIELDDNAFDISDADISTNNTVITPEKAFINSYIELCELYNSQVLELYKALHPFNIKGKPVKKRVHSLFGMAFFPTKLGSIHMMRIYIILVNINTESAQSVQIIVKDIPNFEWDRNYLYISAATGKIIRQIIAGVVGKTF